MLTTADLIIDTAMLILIWIVQCIIYPAFHDIDVDRFSDWHRRYMRTIAFFVIPLMLSQVVLTALEACTTPDAGSLLSIGGIAAAWIVTFGISAPCHRKLQRIGKDRRTIDRVTRTNWLRTLVWTTVWLAGLTM